jgi:hypothetical protein
MNIWVEFGHYLGMYLITKFITHYVMCIAESEIPYKNGNRKRFRIALYNFEQVSSSSVVSPLRGVFFNNK